MRKRLFLSFLFLATRVEAQATARKPEEFRSGWALVSGYGQIIRLGPGHSDASFLTVIPQWGLHLGRRVEYVAEAHVSRYFDPKGIIGGVLPLGIRFSPQPGFPYLGAAAGVGWTDHRNLEEINRKFNFLLQAGVGWSFQNPTGNRWSVELRLFHLSNADTADRNLGLNTLMLLIGRSL